jgi:peptide/nickel transport system ATP-binding protein
MALLSELSDLKVYFYDGRDKRFIRAVENVGFTLYEGSVLGVVGESGCGKTATALSMMGLIESEPGLIGGKFFLKPSPKDAGAIAHALNRGTCERGDYKRENLYNLFCGLDRFVNFEENPFTIVKDSEKWLRRNDRVMEHIRGKNISMVFQNPGRSLNPFIPIGVQLERTIKRFIGEKDKYEIRERAVELLRSVRLKRPELIMNMYARTLSLGMAQRVIIAIALCSHPRLLIADEPTTGLDTTNIHNIIDLLETLRNEMNLTLLLISHNIRIVSTIATDILVMYSGIVVEMGTKKDVIIVKRGFKHPYTEALVSSIPSDSDIKRGKKLREIPGIVPNNKREMDFCPFLERCSYARGKIRRKCKSACPELMEVSPGHYIRCYLFSS